MKFSKYIASFDELKICCHLVQENANVHSISHCTHAARAGRKVDRVGEDECRGPARAGKMRGSQLD